MLTIHNTVVHHVKASGPVGLKSIIAYLDEQCTDPEWKDIASRERWGCPSKAVLEARIIASKRDGARNALAELVSQGKVSVYGNDPEVTWW